MTDPAVPSTEVVHDLVVRLAVADERWSRAVDPLGRRHDRDYLRFLAIELASETTDARGPQASPDDEAIECAAEAMFVEDHRRAEIEARKPREEQPMSDNEIPTSTMSDTQPSRAHETLHREIAAALVDAQANADTGQPLSAEWYADAVMPIVDRLVADRHAGWRAAHRLAAMTGWAPFGTHADQSGVQLEFAGQDDAGDPLWERPRRALQDSDAENLRCVAGWERFVVGGKSDRFGGSLLRVADFLDRIGYDTGTDTWLCDQGTRDQLDALTVDRDQQRASRIAWAEEAGEMTHERDTARKRAHELTSVLNIIEILVYRELGYGGPIISTADRVKDALDKLRGERDAARAELAGLRAHATATDEIPQDQHLAPPERPTDEEFAAFHRAVTAQDFVPAGRPKDYLAEGERVWARRLDRAATEIVGTLLPYDESQGERVQDDHGTVWHVNADSVEPIEEVSGA